MPITLSLKRELKQPTQLAGLLPETLAGQSTAAIHEIPMTVGHQTLPLGDLFHVEGEPDEETLVLQGNLECAESIGEGMSRGTLTIRGNVGAGVARRMSGGRVEVHGSAGSWAGAQMSGGELTIRGDAGHDLGSSEPGQTTGMRGGTILVTGDAGDHVGRGMRRGTIAVRGSCGAGAMMDAAAGTVLIFGKCGRRLGAGMKRGTLFLFGESEPAILPTFRLGRDVQPLFVRLIIRDLAKRDFEIDPTLSTRRFRVYHGDLQSLGLGEILVLEP